MGQRLTDDGGAVVVSRSRRRSSSSRSTGRAAHGSANLLPHTAKVADDLCFIKSMHTEPINHDPAITFFQTGFQLAGRPSIGSWLAYGLGQREQGSAGVRRDDVARRAARRSAALRPLVGQRLSADAVSGREVPLADGSGAVPLEPAGHRCEGAPAIPRRPGELNQAKLAETGDPEIATRIAQYEMAFRMQTLGARADRLLERAGSTFELYGAGRAQAGHVRSELPAGAPAGRTRRALHPAVPPRLGPARAAAGSRSAASARTPISRRPRWSRI